MMICKKEYLIFIHQQLKGITKTDEAVRKEKALKKAFINEKLFRND